MATGPKLPQSPLEALNGEPREAPFLSQFIGPGVGALMGLTAVFFANWGTRRPLLSGIQRHILMTFGGAALGKYLDDWRSDYLAERDAVFRHYIELHPDDFQPYQRVKYANLLEPWTPIR